MAGESQQEPATGQADPTVLTTEALARGLSGERDYQNAKREVVMQRLDDIDRATALLSTQVNKVPSDTTIAIGHLHSLTNEKFTSIQTQFKERDTRQERESRDNKVAVDAAFAAQKEAAAAAAEASREAIAKSERATAETIKSNQELNLARADAQQKQQDDLATRLTTIEASRQGGQAQRTQAQAGWGVFVAVGGLILALIVTAVTVIVATR